MNCPQCFADNPEKSKFCVQCGQSIEAPEEPTAYMTSIPGVQVINTASPASVFPAQSVPTPPLPIFPTPATAHSGIAVPPALSEPIVLPEGALHKEFGELITQKGRPSIGVGYVTALLSVAAFVLLFIPLFDNMIVSSNLISTNGSFFSALTILFRSDARDFFLVVLTQAGVELVPGLSLESLLLFMKIVIVLVFSLPVVNLILSFATRGNTRFYLLLITSLIGGGVFSVLRAVVDTVSVQLNSMALAVIPSFIPAIVFSIVAYFLTLLFAFFGCRRKQKLITG